MTKDIQDRIKLLIHEGLSANEIGAATQYSGNYIRRKVIELLEPEYDKLLKKNGKIRQKQSRKDAAGWGYTGVYGSKS